MDPESERRSLAENPIPPQLDPKINPAMVCSHILYLDQEILEHKEIIAKLSDERKSALEYAIATNTGADDGAIIIVREKESNREIDPKLFKEQKPDVFEKARQVEIAAAQEKIQKQIDDLSKLEVGEPVIRIKTVETMLSETEIATVCRPRKVTMTYEVLRAGAPMPKGKGVRLLTAGEP